MLPMSLLSRFFGRKDDALPKPAAAPSLTANVAIDNPLCLQVLFPEPLAIEAPALAAQLQKMHPSMQGASCEFLPGLDLLGLAGWDKHVVRLVGMNAPMPRQCMDACVTYAHYRNDIKERAHQARSHILLYYTGYDGSALEQYIALILVAEALAPFGAIAILNEHAHASLPSGVLKDIPVPERLEALHHFPLVTLFCGFVKYDVAGTKGVWVRTFGADKFGMPDLAALAEGHHEGTRYSQIFDRTLSYLLESGASLEAGHTTQMGQDTFMKVRDPEPAEYFLKGPGRVLVISFVDRADIDDRVRQA
jgi:hypothetical protein